MCAKNQQKKSQRYNRIQMHFFMPQIKTLTTTLIVLYLKLRLYDMQALTNKREPEPEALHSAKQHKAALQNCVSFGYIFRGPNCAHEQITTNSS